MTQSNNITTSSFFKYFIYHPKSELIEGKEKALAQVGSIALGALSFGMIPTLCKYKWAHTETEKHILKKAICHQIKKAPTPSYPRPFPNPFTGHLIIGSHHKIRGRGLFLSSLDSLRQNLEVGNPLNLQHVISLCPTQEISRSVSKKTPSLLEAWYEIGEQIEDDGHRNRIIRALLFLCAKEYCKTVTGEKEPTPKTFYLSFITALSKEEEYVTWCAKIVKQWHEKHLFASFKGDDKNSFESYFHLHFHEIEQKAKEKTEVLFEKTNWKTFVHSCSRSPETMLSRKAPTQKEIRDALKQPVETWFEPLFQVVDKAVFGKERVFVHCQMGISRSVAFLAAYLINRFDVTTREALNFLTKRRPQANTQFVYELEAYEKLLKDKRATNPSSS